MPGFDLRSVYTYMKFVVDRVTLGQVPSTPYPYIDFPLAISFHLCSNLICTYMLLLPDGETGEAWEPSKTQSSFVFWGSIGWENNFTWSFYSFEVIQVK
jgi:hypothetical protein